MHPSNHGKYRRAIARNANDGIEIRFLEDAKIKKIANGQTVVVRTRPTCTGLAAAGVIRGGDVQPANEKS